MKTNLSVRDIARVCHEANRALCEIAGDNTQSVWELAAEWQQDSGEAGVRKVLEQPGITPEQLHQNWCDYKVRDGWIYGPVKDADKKEHPCLVPYCELPDEQKYKDVVFRAIVAALTE